ncbi:MAG: hypothetical protein AAF915_15260 [Cyanobacteria bacterium P01_D01_bin.50]
MLAQFQSLYPTGSLITELVQIDRGKYIVRSSVQIEGVTRATGMAAAETIEEAEDRSRTRALMVLAMESKQPQAKVEQKEVAVSSEPNLEVLPNRSLTTAVVTEKEHPTTSTKSSKVTQTPPSNQTAINSTEVTPTLDISPPPEVFPVEDNSDFYDQDLDKPLPIPTYDEPELDAPIENPEIPSDFQPLAEENLTPSNVTPLNKSSSGKSTKKATKTSTTKRKKKAEPIDLSEVIAKTDVEMERLAWTPQQGREHLIQTYGKRGRTLLTEEELLGFLKYLESLPTETEILETDPLAGF